MITKEKALEISNSFDAAAYRASYLEEILGRIDSNIEISANTGKKYCSLYSSELPTLKNEKDFIFNKIKDNGFLIYKDGENYAIVWDESCIPEDIKHLAI